MADIIVLHGPGNVGKTSTIHLLSYLMLTQASPVYHMAANLHPRSWRELTAIYDNNMSKVVGLNSKGDLEWVIRAGIEELLSHTLAPPKIVVAVKEIRVWQQIFIDYQNNGHNITYVDKRPFISPSGSSDYQKHLDNLSCANHLLTLI